MKACYENEKMSMPLWKLQHAVHLNSYTYFILKEKTPCEKYKEKEQVIQREILKKREN